MKVSIITVCFNSAQYIEETIKSVLGQTHDDIEYIIIDGGSTDETKCIVEKYFLDISVFVSEKDKGMYDAVNKGLLRATGDIVAFLNSDDQYVDPKVVADVVDRFKGSPDIGLIYGDLLVDYGGRLKRRVSFPVSLAAMIAYGMSSVVTMPTAFVNLQKNSGIFFDESFQCASDFDYLIRCASNSEPVYFPRLVTRFRRHNKSITNSQSELMREETKFISQYYKKKYKIGLLLGFILKAYVTFRRASNV